MAPAYDSEAMTLSLLLTDLIPKVNSFAIADRYRDMLVMRRSSILKHILFRLLQRRIPYHDAVLSQVLKIRSSVEKEFQIERKGEPSFLVRVDDFPRWDRSTEEFLRFHKILSDNEIPYLLGVIPFPSKEPLNPSFQDCQEIGKNDVEVLKQLSHSSVELAMHGCTHQTTNRTRPTEVVGVKKVELEKKIQKGLEKIRSVNLETEVFVPPFNTFDPCSMEVLGKYFKVVCGGPESILYVGLRLSPSYLSKTLYVPSYYPAYGRVEELLGFVEKVKSIREVVIVPLALHWAWEANNGFVNVRKLCQVIRGHVMPWRSFLATATQF